MMKCRNGLHGELLLCGLVICARPVQAVVDALSGLLYLCRALATSAWIAANASEGTLDVMSVVRQLLLPSHICVLHRQLPHCV